MSTHRFNCCQDIECAYMLIRRKLLKFNPVFSTPNIKLWTKELKGYTGEKIDGYFANAKGITGCTANPGIGSDNIIYESRFIAEIPGDNVAYFADYEPGTVPDTKFVVSGTLIIPEKYKGIAFDNTVVGEDGKLFYQFVKGNIPDSVTPFIRGYVFRDPPATFPTYSRPVIETAPMDGMTAGVNYEKNVTLFPVYYTNLINEIQKDPKKEVIFSFDNPIIIQPGQWNPSKRIGRCSPCRIRWPEGNPWGGELCYQGIDEECGGIPYAYYQTIPETVYILPINLAVCKDENDKQFITVTDTNRGLVTQFSYQKAIIDSTVNCPITEYPEDCTDEKTITTEVCNTVSPADPPITSCNPLAGFAKGFRQTDPFCTKLPVVPCEEVDPCDGVNCELQCPTKTYTVIYRYEESSTECPPDEICPSGYVDFYSGGIRRWIEVFDLNDSNDLLRYNAEKTWCDYYLPFTNGDCSGYLRNRCKEYSFTVPGCSKTPTEIKIPIRYSSKQTNVDCSAITEENDVFLFDQIVGRDSPCPGPIRGANTGTRDCCCCGYDGRGDPCDQAPPPQYNIALIRWAKKTSFVPNPFLIYLSNGAYFIGNKINFAKYIDNYFTVWSNYAQEFYPDVISFSPYFKNPECNNNYPEYFFANFDLGLTAAQSVYDERICSQRYDKLSNPTEPRKCLFSIGDLGARNSVACEINVKHGKLENYSFNLACLQQDTPDAYAKDLYWSKLAKKWTMNKIPFYGNCNGEGITLDIQMPKGLTLTDCTNVLSWEFLRNAPK